MLIVDIYLGNIAVTDYWLMLSCFFCMDQILKKICDHPLLLTKKAAEGVLEGMDEMLNHEELGMVEEMAKNLASMTDRNDVQQLDHNVSCKICFIMTLLVRILVYYFHLI